MPERRISKINFSVAQISGRNIFGFNGKVSLLIILYKESYFCLSNTIWFKYFRKYGLLFSYVVVSEWSNLNDIFKDEFCGGELSRDVIHFNPRMYPLTWKKTRPRPRARWFDSKQIPTSGRGKMESRMLKPS